MKVSSRHPYHFDQGSQSMPNQLDRPTLGELLKQLKTQVLATRDNPAPPAPGEVRVNDVYAEAEAARYSPPFHP